MARNSVTIRNEVPGGSSTPTRKKGEPMTRKLMVFALVVVVGAPAFASNALADDKEGKEILQRVMKAVGGERSLARFKAPMLWMERGRYYGGGGGEGRPFVAQYAARWPDWYRQEIEGAFAITASGKKAWVSRAAGGVQKLAGARLAERLKRVRAAWARRLFPLTDKSYKLSRIDGVEVDGRATVGLKASHSDGRDIKFFFDEKTYLIAKIEMEVLTSGDGAASISSEAFFTDHRYFGGVKMPSKMKLLYDKKLYVETETVDYKIFATVDPGLFKEPT